jgi:hypothetical protein
MSGVAGEIAHYRTVSKNVNGGAFWRLRYAANESIL